MMRALVIDKPYSEARITSLMLSTVGIETDCGDSGELGLKLLSRNQYNVVLLEVMLPDIDGYEVLRRMRSAGDDTPVMMVSSLSATNSKLNAFSGGADDYLVKPFDKDELVARTKAVVQRRRTSRNGGLRVGPLTVNPATREVRVNDQIIMLTNKEYEILKLLVLREGLTLTKEALMIHIYGSEKMPDGKIIDVFICKLRKKLANVGADYLISTVWGSGYVVRDPNLLGEALRRNISDTGVQHDKFHEPMSGYYLSHSDGRRA